MDRTDEGYLPGQSLNRIPPQHPRPLEGRIVITRWGHRGHHRRAVRPRQYRQLQAKTRGHQGSWLWHRLQGFCGAATRRLAGPRHNLTRSMQRSRSRTMLTRKTETGQRSTVWFATWTRMSRRTRNATEATVPRTRRAASEKRMAIRRIIFLWGRPWLHRYQHS